MISMWPVRIRERSAPASRGVLLPMKKAPPKGGSSPEENRGGKVSGLAFAVVVG